MEAVKDLPKILNRQDFQAHIEVDGDLRKVLDAPVTEALLVYFPSDTIDSEKATISSKAHEIAKAGLAVCSDAKAAYIGWSVENDFPVIGSKEKERKVGSVLGVFVGWASLDAAESYWEKNTHEKEFEDIVKIREALEMVTRFIEVKKFGERGKEVW